VIYILYRCLKASDSDSSNVAILANQFGFWSAGHFARDYKAMFGDLPSQTLQGTAKLRQGIGNRVKFHVEKEDKKQVNFLLPLLPSALCPLPFFSRD